MTTTLAPEAQISPAAPPISRLPLANFWVRILAFALDTMLLGLLATVVAAIGNAQFLASELLARAVGYALLIAYFGYLQSRPGGGQTVGQRLLGIGVVDRDGQLLSPSRAAARAAIFWFPFTLSELPLPLLMSYSPTVILLGVLQAILIAGIVYFYLANRRSRQSIHDLCTGAYVVKMPGSAPVDAAPISPQHYLVFAALMLLLGFGGYAANRASYATVQQLLLPTARALAALDDCTVTNLALYNPDTPADSTLIVTVAPNAGVPPEAVAKEVGALIEAIDPKFDDYGHLKVDARIGYNLVIRPMYQHYVTNKTPKEWRAWLAPAAGKAEQTLNKPK